MKASWIVYVHTGVLLYHTGVCIKRNSWWRFLFCILFGFVLLLSNDPPPPSTAHPLPPPCRSDVRHMLLLLSLLLLAVGGVWWYIAQQVDAPQPHPAMSALPRSAGGMAALSMSSVFSPDPSSWATFAAQPLRPHPAVVRFGPLKCGVSYAFPATVRNHGLGA